MTELQSLSRRQTLGLLAVVLATALFVRLQLFTGMVRGDDFHYAQAAYELSQGRTHFDVWPEGTARVGLYGPVALLYAVFGVSEATTLAFPLLASLGTVVIVFALGALVGGAAAGLLGAMLWAVFPLDIFLATDLLPDGPLTFFTAAGVYAVLRAESGRGRARWGWAGLTAGLLLWALLIKPTAIATLAFVAAYLLVRLGQDVWARLPEAGQRRAGWGVAGVIVLLGLGLVALQYNFFWLKLGRTASEFAEVILQGRINLHADGLITTYTPLFFVFGPLLLAALLAALAGRMAGGALLGWGLFNVFFYEWGSFGLNLRHYNPLQDWADGRYMLYVFPPLVALAGVFMAQRVNERRLLIGVGLWAGLVAAGAWAAVEQPALAETVFKFASLAALPLVVLALAWEPLEFRKIWRGGLGLGLVLLLGLAGLAPTPPYDGREFATDRALVRGLAALADEAALTDETLVYTDRINEGLRLDLAFGFELAHNWRGAFPERPENRLRVWPPGEAVPPGSVLVLFDPANLPPDAAQLISEKFVGDTLLFRAYLLEGGDGE